MIQTKFFSANTQMNLEQTVNNFTLGKHVINISYTIAPSEFHMGEHNYQVTHYKHCCCVMYEEVGRG